MELLIVFMVILLMVLIVLVANLLTMVRSLQRDMSELMRRHAPAARQDAPPQQAADASPSAAQPAPAPPYASSPGDVPRPHATSDLRAVPGQQAVPQQRPQTSKYGPSVPPDAAWMDRPAPSQQGFSQRPQQSQVPTPPRRQTPTNRPTQPARPQQAQDAAVPSRVSLENVLGTRVLAILAALLVFAGLVFLAILVVPSLSDQVRCAAMFVLSGAITVAGLAVNARKKSPFSQALLGCGLGSVFVSLLVTYLYFGYLTDAPAAVLLLLWLAATTFLAMRQKSVALSVVAQLGMAISVCFAYWHGIEQGQTPLVVGYQLMSCVIVVAGCLRSSERWRAAGAFVPMAVSLLVSQIVTSSYALQHDSFGWESYVATMATQLVIVTVLARLTSLLSTRAAQDEKRTTTGMIPHVAAEVLWLTSVGVNVYATLVILRDGPLSPMRASQAALVACGIVVLRWIVTVILQKTRRLDERLSFVSVYLYASACVLLLVMRLALSFGERLLPLVVLVAVALWLTGAVLNDERHQSHAGAFLTADALLMAAQGYRALNTYTSVPLGPAYVLALNVLALVWWRSLKEERRLVTRDALLVACVVATELSLGPAWSTDKLSGSLEQLAAYGCAMLLVAALSFADPARRLDLKDSVTTFLLVNEFVVVAATCLAVASKGPQYYARETPAAAAIAVGTSIVAIGVVAHRLVHLALHRDTASPWKQVLAGILLTLCTTSCAVGILPAGTDALVTVCAMLSALVCIGLGFARRLDALRLFGLVTTLLCVIKIVTVDIRGADSVGRVVAFICGGAICFVISAVYTFAVRRMKQSD